MKTESKFSIVNIFNILKWQCTFILPLLFIILSLESCKKLIEIDSPFTSINEKNVYNTDATAAAVLTGIYAKWSSSNINGFTSNGVITNISLLAGLSSDEVTLFDISDGNLLAFYTNSLSGNVNSLTGSTAPSYWSDIYTSIFYANSAISSLTNNSLISSKVRSQLLGEAKFIRAFCYFYLINIYGDVPLLLGTDFSINKLATRTSIDVAYDQITNDLSEAKNLLSESFLSSNVTSVTNERVRPTKWAASALLARVYLYRGKYLEAENESSVIINQASLFKLDSLNAVFLKNSGEAIWQLQCVSSTQANTGEGYYFDLPSTGPSTTNSYPVYLSQFVVNSFENADQRRMKWIDSATVNNKIYYYPYKYKADRSTDNGDIKEYLMVFRLAELYLIRSESRAQLGRLEDSKADLNLIRNRAGLSNNKASSKEELLSDILHERQIELFTEWGQRWFDLKRLGKIDQVMSIVCPQKGGTWSTNFQLYPIPNSELLADPNLKQNTGY